MVTQLPQFDDSEADTLLAAVMPLGLDHCVPPSVYSTESLKHNSHSSSLILRPTPS